VGIRKVVECSSTIVRLIGKCFPTKKGEWRTDGLTLCDRPKSKFAGANHVHFGEGLENYVTLPIIPEK
jgi:hypothetical protein